MSTVTDEQVEKALALIEKGAANADYFFEQIKSPIWIAPLAEKEIFAKPYPASRKGDTVSFPVWTPGQYLARMADLPAAQSQVSAILENLPESNNPRVYEAIADAALRLPPKSSARLVEQLIRGARLRYQFLLPEQLAKVIVRLAEAGLGKEALRLARVLFEILPAPDRQASDDGEQPVWMRRAARGRVDDWEYGKLLDGCLKPIVEANGVEGFRWLCDLLEEAVSSGREETEGGVEDYSFVWREEVRHGSARRENIRDDLVSAVRDAAGWIISTSPTNLRQLVQELEARPTRIFHRLALYCVDEYGAIDLPLVREELAEPARWGDVGLSPEFELLLRRYFTQLPPSSQNALLEWVAQGPDLSAYVSFREEMDGHPPEDSEVQEHLDVWTRDHLAVIGEHLPDLYRHRLHDLVDKLGEPRMPGTPRHSAAAYAWGDRSPLSEEETISLPWKALFEKLRSWSPPPTSDFKGPTEEGLAGSVRTRVLARPLEAAEHLAEVTDLKPRYLAAIVDALRDALKDGTTLEWHAVLAFLHRVLDRGRASENASTQWQWVSLSAARLVESGFDVGQTAIPMSLRNETWQVLEILASDPNPTPEYEAEYGGDNMGPMTLSLNVVRSLALRCVVRYSLWWRSWAESHEDADALLASGLHALPEVVSLLEAHLDPVADPSLAVRAVYGQWYPWLVLLDRNWAIAHVGQVFPEGAQFAPFFWAAWNAYIVYDRPYNQMLAILRSAYARAIREIQEESSRKGAFGERPSEGLGRHLMTFYWRGEADLGEGELVPAFFAAADQDLRRNALDFVGRSLANLEAEPPPDIRERIRALWDWRSGQRNVAIQELETFGWWFGSGRLDVAWSLRVLMEVLSKSVLPEPDHLVVERLAVIANDFPKEAVECLDLMVDLASEGWAIHGWIDSARIILKAGLGSGVPEAEARAKVVIHRLGSLRYRDFRSLIQDVGQ